MPNSYELVVMLDADAPTDTRTKIVNDAQALLAQHGEVTASKSWGVRQMPYEIEHHGEADYSIFRFQTEPQTIATLDRALKLTEGVLRFRIFEAETEGDLPDSPPLFKREERAYERPPREAQATAELDEEAPAEVPAEAAAEPVGEVAAEPAVEPAVEPAEPAAEAEAETQPEAADAPEAAAQPAE